MKRIQKSTVQSIDDGAGLAKLCRDYADDKKASAPVILDLRKIGGPSEFFFICSAESDPQIKAIVNHVEDSLKRRHGISPWSVHGIPASKWVVMDYSSVLVHVMHEEKRAYYRLEELWNDGVKIL